MANLTTNKQEIEIIIDGKEYYYKLNDTKLKQFKKFQKDTTESLEKMQKELAATDDVGDKLDKMNQELEKLLDFLLGDGTYKELYKKSGSVLTMAELLAEVIAAIASELQEMNKKQISEKERLLQKYMKKK